MSNNYELTKLEEKNTREKVIELWEQGYSEEYIADELDMYIKDVYEIIDSADISRN